MINECCCKYWELGLIGIFIELYVCVYYKLLGSVFKIF